MKNYQLGEIKRILTEKGYKVATQPCELNLIGIRSNPGVVNEFDDILVVFYNDADGNESFHLFAITTDPGRYYMNNPVNVDGTAILAEGQYPVYQYDLHHGDYLALCQRLGPVTVYRDPNRDNKVDFGKTEKGMYGINIHHAQRTGVTGSVGKFSAGCQVFQSIDDFNEVMNLVKEQLRRYGNHFTYTLLNEKDFSFPENLEPEPAVASSKEKKA
jgi:hypothetical protein